MEQRPAPRNRSLALGVLTQFALSHFLAGGCALITFSVISGAGIQGAPLPFVAGLAAALLGLLLTLNIQRSLHLIDLTLAQLVAGLPVATLPRGAWPLRRLFVSLGALNKQVREHAEDERQSAAYRERLLRQVSETAAQEERNRLARDLHDSIKQQLFSISVSVTAARARQEAATPSAQATHDELLDEIAQRAQEAQVEMRALLLQLRPTPLEQIGLVEALRVQAEALGYRSGAQVTVELGELPAETRMPPGAPEALFRIAQEALANIARHARATVVNVRLAQEGDALQLEVRDDGQGFATEAPDQQRTGMGLANIRERVAALGGTVKIQSAPDAGTTLRVSLPLVDPILVAVRHERAAMLDSLEERARNALGFAMNALRLATLFIILGVPFFAFGASLALAVGGVARARLIRTQLALSLGGGSVRVLSVRQNERALLPALFFLCGLAAWYLPVTVSSLWPVERVWQIALLLSFLLSLMSLIALVGWYQITNRHYKQLPTAVLRHTLYTRLRAYVNGFGLWLLVLVLGLAFQRFHPALPPLTSAQWSDAAAVTLLVIIPLVIVIAYLQTLPWNRRLTYVEATHDHQDLRDE